MYEDGILFFKKFYWVDRYGYFDFMYWLFMLCVVVELQLCVLCLVFFFDLVISLEDGFQVGGMGIVWVCQVICSIYLMGFNFFYQVYDNLNILFVQRFFVSMAGFIKWYIQEVDLFIV